ncbi:hypothetical protein NMY22_g15393 [Coprinellus aureogranulatus]|nr:hypothetical protein NMY22_g15393 [Coprinellus aureogranulatus]
MERMKQHSPVIVMQALLAGKERVRVAIHWHDMSHEGLEEASRLCLHNKNPDGMIMVFEPLHKMLTKCPTTTRETSFAQVFGRELHEAREACRRYQVYGDPTELDKAWDIHYGILKKVEKHLP